MGLPLTTYAVDPQGHTSIADGPLLLCYDGSEDARHAIQRAGELFADRPALVVTVWQPTVVPGSLGFAAPGDMPEFVQLDRAAAENAGRLADEGVMRKPGGSSSGPLSAERAAHARMRNYGRATPIATLLAHIAYGRDRRWLHLDRRRG